MSDGMAMFLIAFLANAFIFGVPAVIKLRQPEAEYSDDHGTITVPRGTMIFLGILCAGFGAFMLFGITLFEGLMRLPFGLAALVLGVVTWKCWEPPNGMSDVVWSSEGIEAPSRWIPTPFTKNRDLRRWDDMKKLQKGGNGAIFLYGHSGKRLHWSTMYTRLAVRVGPDRSKASRNREGKVTVSPAGQARPSQFPISYFERICGFSSGAFSTT